MHTGGLSLRATQKGKFWVWGEQVYVSVIPKPLAAPYPKQGEGNPVGLQCTPSMNSNQKT